MRYLLDTNIVISLVNDELASPLPEGRYAVSVITELELLSFSKLSADEEAVIKSFLSLADKVGLTEEVKREAIRLRKNYRLKLPDAIVAASAIAINATLVTNDAKLDGIPELTVTGLALK